ncbi:MAG: hypothetical protein RL701_2600 [Pseudomonadota bacterium]
MTKVTFVLACALACAALLPQSAHAQSRAPLDDPYWGVKLQLGLGSEVSRTLADIIPGFDARENANLDVSIGVAGQYVHPLHKYFAIGGQVGLLSWASSDIGLSNGSRNVLFDLAALPVGRYQVMRELELYATVPLGLSFDFLNDVSREYRTNAGNIASIDGGAAVGFMIGFLAGVRYQLSQSVGLLGELGFVHRTYSHSVTATFGAGSLDGDLSVSFGQFAMNFGAYF